MTRIVTSHPSPDSAAMEVLLDTREVPAGDTSLTRTPDGLALARFFPRIAMFLRGLNITSPDCSRVRLLLDDRHVIADVARIDDPRLRLLPIASAMSEHGLLIVPGMSLTAEMRLTSEVDGQEFSCAFEDAREATAIECLDYFRLVPLHHDRINAWLSAENTRKAKAQLERLRAARAESYKEPK